METCLAKRDELLGPYCLPPAPRTDEEDGLWLPTRPRGPRGSKKPPGGNPWCMTSFGLLFSLPLSMIRRKPRASLPDLRVTQVQATLTERSRVQAATPACPTYPHPHTSSACPRPESGAHLTFGHLSQTHKPTITPLIPNIRSHHIATRNKQLSRPSLHPINYFHAPQYPTLLHPTTTRTGFRPSTSYRSLVVDTYGRYSPGETPLSTPLRHRRRDTPGATVAHRTNCMRMVTGKEGSARSGWISGSIDRSNRIEPTRPLLLLPQARRPHRPRAATPPRRRK